MAIDFGKLNQNLRVNTNSNRTQTGTRAAQQDPRMSMNGAIFSDGARRTTANNGVQIKSENQSNASQLAMAKQAGSQQGAANKQAEGAQKTAETLGKTADATTKETIKDEKTFNKSQRTFEKNLAKNNRDLGKAGRAAVANAVKQDMLTAQMESISSSMTTATDDQKQNLQQQLESLQGESQGLDAVGKKQTRTMTRLNKNSDRMVKQQKAHIASFGKLQQANVKASEVNQTSNQKAIETTSEIKEAASMVQMTGMTVKMAGIAIKGTGWGASIGAAMEISGGYTESVGSYGVAAASAAHAVEYGIEGNLQGCLMSAASAVASGMSAASAWGQANKAVDTAKAAADISKQVGEKATAEAGKKVGEQATAEMTQEAGKEIGKKAMSQTVEAGGGKVTEETLKQGAEMGTKAMGSATDTATKVTNQLTQGGKTALDAAGKETVRAAATKTAYAAALQAGSTATTMGTLQGAATVLQTTAGVMGERDERKQATAARNEQNAQARATADRQNAAINQRNERITEASRNSSTNSSNDLALRRKKRG